MSFTTLLSRTATITHRAQTGVADRYNRPEWVETGTTSVRCYIEQRRREEDVADREAQIGTHLLILPATVTVDGSDHIQIEGRTYEVIGPPWGVDQPTRGNHHYELTVREVTG